MHFYQNPVRTCRHRCQAHRLDQVPLAGSVARVNDHREMGEALDDRDRGNVKRVPGVVLERLDPTLAHHHLHVAAVEDVLGSHDPLLHRHTRASLQHDRRPRASYLAQERIVLAVPCADLQDVGVPHNRVKRARFHHLGNDGQTGELTRLLKQLQAILAQALETVRR